MRRPASYSETAGPRRFSQYPEFRGDLREEKWRQFRLGGFLYVVLGGFFAAMLAQDVLQALLIGAGRTGIIGTLGLSRETDTRAEALDQQSSTVENLKNALTAVQEKAKKTADLERKLEELGLA